MTICPHTTPTYSHPEGDNDVYFCPACGYHVIYTADDAILARDGAGRLHAEVEKLPARGRRVNAPLLLSLARLLASRQETITPSSLQRLVGGDPPMTVIVTTIQQLVDDGQLLPSGKTRYGSATYQIEVKL